MDQNIIIGVVMVIGFIIIASKVLAYRTRQNDMPPPPPESPKVKTEYVNPTETFKPGPKDETLRCLRCHSVMLEGQMKCVKCGWDWGLEEENQTEEKEDFVLSESMLCYACGEAIPGDKDTCPKCGWSWKSA